MQSVVGVLYGGVSDEHIVSIGSGEFLVHEMTDMGLAVEPILLGADPVRSILAAQSTDFIIALHGGWGEDGRIQSLLELLGKRYSGSRALASALAMNKAVAKQVFSSANIPTPQWEVIRSTEEFHVHASRIPGPWVMKPVSEGSSNGVTFIESPQHAALLEPLLAKYRELILETYIEGRIMTVAILDLPGQTDVLRPIEIQPLDARLYDCETKFKETRKYNLSPALSPSVLDLISDTALAAHRSLKCSGVTRVDLMHSPKNGPFVLEVNTVPGLGPTGNLVTACEAQGISRQELVKRILATIG